MHTTKVVNNFRPTNFYLWVFCINFNYQYKTTTYGKYKIIRPILINNGIAVKVINVL